MIEGILEAYVNVARNEPFRGGTYYSLPEKLKNKNAIINIQYKDNQCLRWAIRAALFPTEKGKKTTRPGSYPINDGLNFSEIDFPTPVSQINRLEKQNPNLAIQCVAQFSYTLVCNRYLFVCATKISEFSIKDSPFTYLQYIKRLAASSTYVQNYAIFPETPKLPSLRTPGPVFVHRQNNISPRKRSTQTDASATLLSAYRVFSSVYE